MMGAMPRIRREYVPVRLDPELVAWLDDLAAASGRNRSEEIRAQLAARKAALERAARRRAKANGRVSSR